MTDLLKVEYAQTGTSTRQDALGMREMQARAYAARNAQYLLLKAPPASGKSRALMFIALDKIEKQGLRKAIIAVPEMAIGKSFANTDLVKHGFFADWRIAPEYELCTPGSAGKVEQTIKFLEDPDAHYLLCPHATLRFTWERLGDARKFDGVVLAIDEFHHTSAEDGNKLGAMLDDLMQNSSAHIVAMTGSYFRGDQVPILTPETEAKFTQVTYTYYEQLNGYAYLKSLGLGYHFYQGRYIDALAEVLDLGKKTIIHIPNVNAAESSGQKYDEVDAILDIIGSVEKKDERTGIMTLRAKGGRKLLVADLVTDDAGRANVIGYLRGVNKREDMDIIIALGMAKEGFDWPWCEHVLTIGRRSSLTEVVQIIGRATRDCPGKPHAQFTNLIPQPDAEDEDVKNAVNAMLKAITLSLLMREVLAPNITFRPRSSMAPGEKPKPGQIVIDDTAKPLSNAVKKILEEDGINRIIQTTFNTPEVINPAIAKPEQQTLLTDLPKIVTRLYPDLTPEERSEVCDMAATQLFINGNGGLVTADSAAEDMPPGHVFETRDGDGDAPADHAANQFLRIRDKLINVDTLDIDLIAAVNPFRDAYEILSKALDAPMLKSIQDHVAARQSPLTENDAIVLWPNVKKFTQEKGRPPSPDAIDSYERTLAEALAIVRNSKARQLARQSNGGGA